MLSREAVEKYIALYEREFGLTITFEEASEQAQRFLNVARVVMQPMPKHFERRYKELLAQKKEYETRS